MDEMSVVTGQHERQKREIAARLRREMTPSERKLWSRLRAGRLAGLHFRRQQIVDGFIVDFYCHAAGLVVELDGAVHARQAEYDAERTRILQARSLLLLRFPNARIETDLESVLSEITRAAHRRLP